MRGGCPPGDFCFKHKIMKLGWELVNSFESAIVSLVDKAEKQNNNE